MQFTLILVAIVVATTHSYPAEMMSSSTNSNDVVKSPQSRPVQQFFKKILEALRPTTTTTTEKPRLTLHIEHSPYLHTEFQEIPNYIDYSTYLLDSLSSENAAVSFAMGANSKPPKENSKNVEPSSNHLRGNFSVISFIVPNNNEDDKTRGIVENFLNFLRRPWSRVDEPADTVYSQFPPVIEYFTQRLQAYFSIYKYPDESRLNNTIVLLIPDSMKKETLETTLKDEVKVTAETDETLITTNDNEVESTTQLELGEMSTDKIIEME